MVQPLTSMANPLFDLTGNLDVVNLFDAVTWVSKAVGQFAVVCNDDQAFGCHVESTDAKHAGRVRRHEIGNSHTARRVASGGNYAGRFVDGEVG